ncbi:MAG: sugar kinase [Verrucomicrobiota bacterium]|nr:sugar kinase [Verrucomicrobiota bacterium]
MPTRQKIVTFGEVMGRFAPDSFLRFVQVFPGKLTLTFGGAESNVAGSISNLGGNSCFVTALPKNPLGDACIAYIRGLNVDVQHIVRTDNGRLGLYFVETGANQRPSNVVYDRADSSVAITHKSAYNWNLIFDGAGWFHTTGITPAISANAADSALAAVKKAKEMGITVSCDLNFRKKLWKWDSSKAPRELAEETMRKMLPYIDVVIANEADASDVLSIKAKGTDVESGNISHDSYSQVAQEIVRQFPNVKKVAITLRESLSASHNNWGAMLYDAKRGKTYYAPLKDGKYCSYKIHNIVDRVGGGDSFAAGLIFALNMEELSDSQNAILFAVASSCLAHSISGDMNYSSRNEVEELMKGTGSGRVKR